MSGDVDPAGDRLREAIRRGVSSGADLRDVDGGAFIDRVHRGARRRRARRAGGMAAAAAVTAGAVAVAVPVLIDANTAGETPVATGGADRDAPRTDPLAVYDVHVPGDGSVWALASRDCGRARLCPVVARSSDSGQHWVATEPKTSDGDDVLPEVRHLAVSDTGDDVVVGGAGVATSHDSGETWRRVGPADGHQVRGVASGATDSVAVFDQPGPTALSTSPVDTDEWSTADVPVASDEQLSTPFAGGDVTGAVVVSGGVPQAVGLVVHHTESAWSRLDRPCTARTPLVSTDGSTIWYLCYSPAGSVLATSSDISDDLDEPTWTRTELPGAHNAGIGAWDDGIAVVSTDQQVFRVDAGGGVTELTGPGSGLDLPPDDYTFRSIDDGWLASFRGRLLSSTDGGRTWSPVTVR